MESKQDAPPPNSIPVVTACCASVIWLLIFFAVAWASASCVAPEATSKLIESPNSHSVPASRLMAWLSSNLFCLTLNEVGDMFAGAFAPLAFIWLTATVFLQRSELEQTRHEFRQQRSVFANQTTHMKDANATALANLKVQYKLNNVERWVEVYNSIASARTLVYGDSDLYSVLDRLRVSIIVAEMLGDKNISDKISKIIQMDAVIVKKLKDVSDLRGTSLATPSERMKEMEKSVYPNRSILLRTIEAALTEIRKNHLSFPDMNPKRPAK